MRVGADPWRWRRSVGESELGVEPEPSTFVCEQSSGKVCPCAVCGTLVVADVASETACVIRRDDTCAESRVAPKWV